MPDIYHDVPISGSADTVFENVATPKGLSKWWSKDGFGKVGLNETYSFDFGPDYQWKAKVEEYVPKKLFAIRMTSADDDWTGSLIRFRIEESEGNSMLRFEHIGWPDDNPHYRSSSYCWAMYLRCLKNFVEKGEELPYEKRFSGE